MRELCDSEPSTPNTQHSKLFGRRNLARALMTYRGRYPEEAPVCDRFIDFVENESRCYERDCWAGHVTGAAWLVNQAGTHILLTHHRKLERWLQLGGHSDGDADTARVALREAHEESGLAVRLLDAEDSIFDIDIHPIAARKSDPDHWHFDVRLAMQVVDSEQFVVSEESYDLRWVPIAGLPDFTQEQTIIRMGQKWLARTT